jgi:hypothetical protein
MFLEACPSASSTNSSRETLRWPAAGVGRRLPNLAAFDESAVKTKLLALAAWNLGQSRRWPKTDTPRSPGDNMRSDRLFQVFFLVLALQFFSQLCSAQESTVASPVAQPTEDEPEAIQPRNPLERTTIHVDTELDEGWQMAVPVRPGSDACDSYQLWVKDGWFYVRRTDKHGDLDWQLQLAELRRIGVPAISMTGEGVAFQVSSEDGRYFIRETMHLLRAVRQRGRDDGTVLRRELLGDESKSMGYGSTPDLTLSGWNNESWFYAASGPDIERVNYVVRLNPLELKAKGYGFQSVARDFA